MKKIFAIILAALAFAGVKAQTPDPNFYIYLCIGQSNMEGNAQIEPIDRDSVPDRFLMMAAVDYDNPQRVKGQWYKAVPPLVRQGTGLTPADWFGRTMVDNLPDSVRVGVIMVAVGGCKIEHLDKDYDPAQVVQEANWFQGFMKAYDNRPYERLLACAKEAQKQGVIKGILLHQGCSNTNDQQWPDKVSKVYNDLLTDLGLDAASVPLLAGEVVQSDMGGVCGTGINPIIDRLPQTVPTAHVISSEGLAQKGDGLHFTPHAYRVLGCRYAAEMLKTMGIDNPVINYSEEGPYVPHPVPAEGDYVFDLTQFNPSLRGEGTFDAATSTFVGGQFGFGGWDFAAPLDLSDYAFLIVELEEPQMAGAALCVFDKEDTNGNYYSRGFNENTVLISELKGMMKNLNPMHQEANYGPLATDKVGRLGFFTMGGRPVKIKHVFATNRDPYAE